MAVRLFEVGGCVRDWLLDRPAHDVDFAAEAESFTALRDFLTGTGFTVFTEAPQFLTLRARFPREATDPAIPTRFTGTGLTADFVLARRDSVTSDGRRPTTVTPGTIADDLARRDFTVNAIARDRDGVLIDPHGGRADLAAGVLRTVGDPATRFREDALRVLRAVRFTVTHALTPDPALAAALRQEWLPGAVAAVSVERVREELHKAFTHDTGRTFDVLAGLPRSLRSAVLGRGLWLKPTLETARA